MQPAALHCLHPLAAHSRSILSGKVGDPTEASLSKLGWAPGELLLNLIHHFQVKHQNMSKDLTGWRKGLGATSATPRLLSWS